MILSFNPAVPYYIHPTQPFSVKGGQPILPPYTHTFDGGAIWPPERLIQDFMKGGHGPEKGTSQARAGEGGGRSPRSVYWLHIVDLPHVKNPAHVTAF